MTQRLADNSLRRACRRGEFASGETLYFGSGATLVLQSGSTLQIDDGANATVEASVDFGDAETLNFGDSDDIAIQFDGTDFLLNAAAASTEFKIEKDIIVKHGAQASVVGSGVPLSATDTAAFSVFSDDGNAAIGSGTLTRAGRFRNLQVYTGGNREQEACGVIGQLVSIAGTNRHNMCGVMGSYEAGTSLVVDGQAWSTDPWVQAAVIGRVGCGNNITTINSNGILAGLAAMSNTTSFAANNGIYAGLYVGSWSGTTDWVYGVYVQGGAVKRAFQAGEQASTAGSGVTLDATYPAAMQVFTDDGGASIGSGTLTRAGRFRNLQTYTGGNREQEACGAIGQIVSVGGTNRHNMCGLMGSYEVGTSLTVDGQAFATDPWIQAAVIGRIGAGSGITTVNSNARFAGVAAMCNTVSLASNSGVFSAFYAGHWSGCMDWEYGIYAEGVAHGAYFDVDAGAISGEEHAFDIANTGTLSSGDSLVGANIVTTCAGTAGSWVSGLFCKATQASKMVNGYICAAEFELTSTAANASDNSVIVINSVRNHTGSPPACDPYIMLREYGTTYGNVLVRFGAAALDTGMGSLAGIDATTLVTQTGAGYEANVDCAIRCMAGSTPIWICASTTAPS